MKISLFSKTLFLLIILISSCSKEERQAETLSGKLTISFNIENPLKSISKVKTTLEPKSIYISIKDSEQKYICNLDKLPLIKINDKYITEQIELIAGDYTIEDFIIVDNNDSALYLIPKIDSKLKDLVNNPLPLSYNVSENEITSVCPEVIPANLADPTDFGYATFSFTIVNTLDIGLNLHLPFSGSISDVSGNGHLLTETNISLVEDRNGKSSMASHFNGLDSRINIDNDSSIITSNEFTISSWVRMDSVGGGVDYPRNIIFQQRDDDASNYSKSKILFASEDKTGNVEFTLKASNATSGENIVLESPAPNYGGWHHYVASLNNNNEMKIHIDGIMVADTTFEQSGDFTTSIDHVDIGIHTYSGNQIKGVLNGAMDDFRIYNRALTDQEIYDLFKLD